MFNYAVRAVLQNGQAARGTNGLKTKKNGNPTEIKRERNGNGTELSVPLYGREMGTFFDAYRRYGHLQYVTYCMHLKLGTLSNIQNVIITVYLLKIRHL